MMWKQIAKLARKLMMNMQVNDLHNIIKQYELDVHAPKGEHEAELEARFAVHEVKNKNREYLVRNILSYMWEHKEGIERAFREEGVLCLSPLCEVDVTGELLEGVKL